jgi:DNA polymerase
MSTLLIDCETFSEVSPRDVGSHVYAKHPSTRVTLWSVRDPDWARSLVFEEPNLWKLLKQLKDTKQIEWTKNEPLDLIHWSPFDRHIVEYSQTFAAADDGWDHDSDQGAIAGPNNTFWCDLSELSLIYGGPLKLSHAARFWANTETKDEGKHLIARFCSPQPDGSVIDKGDDPVRWEQFRQYAGQDTNVMVPIYNRFIDLAENGGESFDDHWPHVRVIGRMNERGVPVDRESAEVAQGCIDRLSQELKLRCVEKYGFESTRIALVREYLGTDNCQKDTLEDYLDAGKGTADQLELAMIRLVTSGVAAKKIIPMLSRSVIDGRVRDCFLYQGAATRRLTSLGVQFHNMLRHESSDAFFKLLGGGAYDLPELRDEVFADVRLNIRGFVQCAEGRTLVAADYSQVELRVGACLAGEDWLIKAFEDGRDPYLITASRLYGEEITEKGDPRRQYGKIVELAALFGLGRFGLMKASAKQGIEITETYAQRTVDVYRSTHKAVVECWADCERAFVNCMRSPAGHVEDMGPFVFERIESAIKLVRPSGFAQYYWLPRWTKSHWDSCEDGECHGCKDDITFTGRGPGGVMIKKTTYGGDLFQSGVQGTAADLMIHGMGVVEAGGYPPIMSVHDEVVCEIEDDDGQHTEVLCDLLCELPDWADGLPIQAEGWQQRRFTK